MRNEYVTPVNKYIQLILNLIRHHKMTEFKGEN